MSVTDNIPGRVQSWLGLGGPGPVHSNHRAPQSNGYRLFIKLYLRYWNLIWISFFECCHWIMANQNLYTLHVILECARCSLVYQSQAPSYFLSPPITAQHSVSQSWSLRNCIELHVFVFSLLLTHPKNLLLSWSGWDRAGKTLKCSGQCASRTRVGKHWFSNHRCLPLPQGFSFVIAPVFEFETPFPVG